VAQCVTLQVGPQRQTKVRPQGQEGVGVAGKPAPFSRRQWRPRQGYED